MGRACLSHMVVCLRGGGEVGARVIKGDGLVWFGMMGGWVDGWVDEWVREEGRRGGGGNWVRLGRRCI